jgi:hypothetical protein
VPVATVSDVWLACWELSQEVTPKLNFRSPGLKPGRAMWFRVTEAEGFQPGEPARLIYRANRGQADLQFRRTNVAQLAARVGARLDPDMRVVRATSSASMRLAVPKIDFSGAPEQQAAIRAGLEAYERLHSTSNESVVDPRAARKSLIGAYPGARGFSMIASQQNRTAESAIVTVSDTATMPDHGYLARVFAPVTNACRKHLM